jgi:DNA-binding NarL/FixJ family response regulator
VSAIKLLIIDDCQIVREGLTAMLGFHPGVKIVGSCGSATEALEFLTHTVCDVVLMDLQLKDKNGLEAAREIKARFPAVKVIILSVREDLEAVCLSLSVGASGYILKQVSPATLLESIQRVDQGEIVIDPDLLEQLINNYVNLSRTAEVSSSDRLKKVLTPRESELLMYLAQGMSNKEISQKAGLATSTVKTHLWVIYKKLGVKSRLQVINLLKDLKRLF